MSKYTCKSQFIVWQPLVLTQSQTLSPPDYDQKSAEQQLL